MLGEYVSQFDFRFVWVAFQLPLWILRWAILVHFQEFREWKIVDAIVWMSVEAVGSLFGAGARANGVEWATVGPLIGFVLAPSMWLMFWFLRYGKNPGGRKWFLAALFWGFVGFFAGTASCTIGLLSVFELGNWANSLIYPNVGWAIAGTAIGGFVGSMTGFAIAGLLKKPIPKREFNALQSAIEVTVTSGK